MKLVVYLVAVLLAVPAFATNEPPRDIDLKLIPAKFEALNGREYDVRLVRATLDGVVYRQTGGGGLISYTNLSPELLIRWGIPTNRISQSIARTEAKRRARAQYDALGSQFSHQRAYQNALDQARKNYEAKVKAAQANVLPATQQLQEAHDRLVYLRRQSKAAWDYYIYTDPHYVRVVTGQPIDNEVNRRARAYNIDRQIADLQSRMPEMERAVADGEAALKDELSRLAEEYQHQVAAIHETFNPQLLSPDEYGAVDSGSEPLPRVEAPAESPPPLEPAGK